MNSDVAETASHQQDSVGADARRNPWVSESGRISNNGTGSSGNPGQSGETHAFPRRGSECGGAASDAELWLNSLTESFIRVDAVAGAESSNPVPYPYNASDRVGVVVDSPAHVYFSNGYPSNGLLSTAYAASGYQGSSNNSGSGPFANDYPNNGYPGNGSTPAHFTGNGFSVGTCPPGVSYTNTPAHRSVENDVLRMAGNQNNSCTSPQHPYNFQSSSSSSHTNFNPSSAPIYQPSLSANIFHPFSAANGADRVSTSASFGVKQPFASSENFSYSATTGAINPISYDHQLTSNYDEYYPGFGSSQDSSHFTSFGDSYSGSTLGDRNESTETRSWNNCSYGDDRSFNNGTAGVYTNDQRTFHGKETNPFTGMVNPMVSKTFELTL